HAVVDAGGEVHDAERMLKACVHRARIYMVGPGKLTNPPQSLKRRLRDDLSFPVVQRNETVQRTTNLIKTMGVGHRSTPLRLIQWTIILYGSIFVKQFIRQTQSVLGRWAAHR